MRCPFCGAENTGKFCTNCGTKIPEQQESAAQAYQQPAQEYVPIQPAQQDFVPIVPDVQEQEYVPIQPTYATPITQPVRKRVKSNGWCSSGLILSIAGWFCLGLLSPFGFICSLIGLFDSARKHQPGRGKAIAGLILSGIILVSMGTLAAFSYKDIQRAFERGDIKTPLDVINIMDEATDRQDSSYKKHVKKITDVKWVERDGSYLLFVEKDSFKFYQSAREPKDNYSFGKYRIYVGNDAFRQITRTYSEYGVTNSELNSFIRKNNLITRDDLVCLVLEYEGSKIGGMDQNNGKREIVYYGYFIEEPTKMLHLTDMGSAREYSFIPKSEG